MKIPGNQEMITSGRVKRTIRTSASRFAPCPQFANEFITFCEAVSLPSRNHTLVIPSFARGVRETWNYQRMVSGWQRHRFAKRYEFIGELGTRCESGSAGTDCPLDAAGSDHFLVAGNFHRRKSRRSPGFGCVGYGSV